MFWRCRIILPILLVCFALVSSVFAQKATSDEAASVKALLEKHDKAFGAHDLKGVMETYASTGELVLMGTGSGEVYLGKQGIESAYAQFFTRFDPGALTLAYDWFFADSIRDVAWFAAEARGTAMVKNEKKEMSFNMSGTLVKQDGGWKLLALHFSRLGAGEAPPEGQTK